MERGKNPLFIFCFSVTVNKVFNGLLCGVVDVILIAAGWEADSNRGMGIMGGVLILLVLPPLLPQTSIVLLTD